MGSGLILGWEAEVSITFGGVLGVAGEQQPWTPHESLSGVGPSAKGAKAWQ